MLPMSTFAKKKNVLCMWRNATHRKKGLVSKLNALQFFPPPNFKLGTGKKTEKK